MRRVFLFYVFCSGIFFFPEQHLIDFFLFHVCADVSKMGYSRPLKDLNRLTGVDLITMGILIIILPLHFPLRFQQFIPQFWNFCGFLLVVLSLP